MVQVRIVTAFDKDECDSHLEMDHGLFRLRGADLFWCGRPFSLFNRGDAVVAAGQQAVAEVKGIDRGDS